LSINLVIDQPDTMSYVTEEMIEKSAKSGQDWLEEGCRNLAGRTPPNSLEVVQEDSRLRLCSVGDAYDAARALLLDSLLPDMPAPGCLVALPSRDELLVLPVVPKALPHVHLLKMLAEKNFKSAPYAISDQVYWVWQGKWHLFPISISG